MHPLILDAKIFFKEIKRSSGPALWISLAASAAVSLTEGVGIFLLVPFLSLMEAKEGILGFETILLLYVGVLAARAYFTWLLQYWNHRLEHRFLHDLRQRLFLSAAHMEWRSWLRQKPSHFLNAMTTEAERAGDAVRFFLSIVSGIFLLSIYSVSAFVISWKLSSLTLASCFIIFYLMKSLSGKVTRDGKQISTATDAFFQSAKDRLDGLKWIRQNACEETAAVDVRLASEQIMNTQIVAGARFGYLTSVLEVLCACGLAATAYFSLKIFSFSLPAVLLYVFIFARILPRLSAIQQDYHEFIGCLPSFSSLYSKMESTALSTTSDLAPNGFLSDIRFNNVSFKHVANVSLLEEVNLCLSKGSFTLITGVSGSGKTTLAELTSGLIFPGSGRVEVDGNPLLPANAASWRKRICVVTQETFLFNDSLWNNLSWAAPEASEDEICDALKKVGLWAMAQKLPEKAHTVVGERGIRLSGGERQRVALARAILRKPDLMILDEPTYALDPANEESILQMLIVLSQEVTILTFMHRVPDILAHVSCYEIRGGRLSPLHAKDSNFVVK